MAQCLQANKPEDTLELVMNKLINATDEVAFRMHMPRILVPLESALFRLRVVADGVLKSHVHSFPSSKMRIIVALTFPHVSDSFK